MTTFATARSSPGGLGSVASSMKRSTTSEAIARSYVRLRGDCADRRALARAGERRTHELAEERGGPRRARLELRMELTCDEPGVIGQLDDLDESPFLERAGHDQPRLDECGSVVVVDLVAVAVTFVHHRLAVRFLRARAFRERHRLRPESHRAAEVLDLLLLGQEIDHRMRRLGIHLRRVRALQAEHVTRELGHRDVHPEADAEIRNLPLARDAAREDLPFPPARAEAAGNKDAVDLFEQPGRFLERHSLRVDPAYAHRAAVVRAGVLEGLVNREVCVLQLDVLADECDLDDGVALLDPFG